MDVSSFLASETGDSEEMFLNFNQFDSGIAFSGEYHLPSNIEQEEGSSVIVDHVGLSQVTCPNATVIEEETDNSNFFRMEQNLFDSIVIPSANKAYITAEALAQVSFPCCAPQSKERNPFRKNLA